MNREADHGQDGDDEDRIELNAKESAEDRERTQYEERVVLCDSRRFDTLLAIPL